MQFESREDHNGVCPFCGALILCLEEDCAAPPNHEYICPECLALELKRPDLLGMAHERTRDGFGI